MSNVDPSQAPEVATSAPDPAPSRFPTAEEQEAEEARKQEERVAAAAEHQERTQTSPENTSAVGMTQSQAEQTVTETFGSAEEVPSDELAADGEAVVEGLQEKNAGQEESPSGS